MWGLFLSLIALYFDSFEWKSYVLFSDHLLLISFRALQPPVHYITTTFIQIQIYLSFTEQTKIRNSLTTRMWENTEFLHWSQPLKSRRSSSWAALWRSNRASQQVALLSSCNACEHVFKRAVLDSLNRTCKCELFGRTTSGRARSSSLPAAQVTVVWSATI